MGLRLQIIDRSTWQRLAPFFLDYNYRQLWDFGVACADRLNATSEHVAVYDNSELVGLADVRIKKIPLLKTGIAYVNGGPLVRTQSQDLCGRDNLAAVLDTLTDKYVKHDKLVMRIQPPIGPQTWRDVQDEVFADMGYETEAQLPQYRTFVLDISEPLDVIRKQLKQKWRNCLNNAEKRGLTITVGTDEGLFAIFQDLYKELVFRKSFADDLSPEFYLSVQNSLPDQEKFLICIIYEDGQPVAGHVSSILGDTCVYLLGATSDAGLKNKSAYLAQWSVIQMAIEHGCEFYDLGGIDPENNPGVYRFKKGLSGNDVTASGPFEIFPNPMVKCTCRYAEKTYHWIKQGEKYLKKEFVTS